MSNNRDKCSILMLNYGWFFDLSTSGPILQRATWHHNSLPVIAILKSNLKTFLACIAFLLVGANVVLSQDKPKIIQFSGVVIADDTVSNGIPGVHLYVAKAGRGTTTNFYGYFTMPVLAKDSVIISSIGYKKQQVVIPELLDGDDKYTIVITLNTDTTYLPPIDIFPFPTEELFKEAVLAYQPKGIPGRDNALSDDVLAQMMRVAPMDASLNYRNYQDLQFNAIHNRYSQPVNTLLDPIRWAKFIKSLKKKKKN